MARIIAFDIGKLGAAAWLNASGVVQSCAIHLAGKTVEDRLAELEDAVSLLLTESGADTAFVERHTRRGKGSQTLDAYTHVIRLACGKRGVAVDRSCAAMTASKLALGKGIADKAARHALAVPLLRIPRTCTPDEADARILLAAAPGVMRKKAFDAEVKRKLRNQVARERRARSHESRMAP